MDSIFDKITTLVNAQVNDFLGRNPKSPLARIKLDPEEVETNPRRTVQSLRKRLDEALAYEDDIQAKIDRLNQEALQLDEQADAMVQSGDEFGARRILSQLNMKQQQLTIAESELRDHRLLTQHLMQEMTTLEMALDSQQRQQSTRQQGSGTRIPVDGVDSSQESGAKTVFDNVSDKINETRSSLENLLNNSPVPTPTEVSKKYEKFDIVDEVPDPRKPKSTKIDKGDMNERLSRLSKPDDE
jgi:phage shock protein A